MHDEVKLKQALAKMLPSIVFYFAGFGLRYRHQSQVLDTELLHLCWLVEETLAPVDEVFTRRKYIFELMTLCGVSPDMSGKWSFVQDFALSHATWQQRTIALCKVKGIEI